MTGEPLAGPASAYPTLSRPALICLSEAKDVCVPGLVAGTGAGLILVDCASAEAKMPSRVAATVMAADLKKRRRSWFSTSGVLNVLMRDVSMLIAGLTSIDEP